jgi:molybdopterin converting factor small subunit
LQVSVKLYGTLRRRRPDSAPGAPHHPFVVSLPHGANVLELSELLGINSGLVSAVAVNGQAANDETSLQDGDEVAFFPPAAGG